MYNKKASTAIFGMMLGLTILILALAMAPIIQDFTNDARNESLGDTIGMDCENSSISSFDKAACVTSDLYLFYFIGSLIFISGLVVTSKILFG